ncbi:MAG TPA: aminotransferase class V-fold PLP-dependent enzyme [Gammaproteobacteria bacterium]|nr:aminotransferase class V-fold PLP-dependent enzyme [Gammaproteobacteria bacterium]
MQRYFQLDKNIVHLNHAAVGPWPVVTRDAVCAFARENASIGSQRYGEWMKTEQQLKQKMATLINARSLDEIAILKNTSEGLSLIAQGLTFKAGDNIVIPAEEFPSNKIVWQALASQSVEVRSITIENSDEPEQVLIDAMDENTRLLSCSSVQFAHGLRLELNVIGQACKQNGTLFCVDAIQSLGAIRFDVQACHADFVVADGHKWMCGPEGTALFYCREAVQDQLRLCQFGWHMMKDAFEISHRDNDLSLEKNIVTGAQRFESGSPNMTGITALDASLGLLLDIGMQKIETRVLEKAGYLIERLTARSDTKVISSTQANRYAGIVTFQKHGVDNMSLYRYLQDNDVICAYRGDGTRFSPHFHTALDDLDKALDLVDDFNG